MGRRKTKKTRYPWVRKVVGDKGHFEIEARIRDPRTGKIRSIERLVRTTTAEAAAALRAKLVAEQQIRMAGPERRSRPRVAEYAVDWLAGKEPPILQPYTHRHYATCVQKHIVPALGDLYLDELRRTDVQTWVTRGLRAGYSTQTVHGWFRVLRTMSRDAMRDLDLPRDPTLGVSFGGASVMPRPVGNTLSPPQLAAVLRAWETRYPHIYPLIATMAFTGLRLVHASALKWSDLDEAASVLHVRRRHAKGTVTESIAGKKRAPARLPLHSQIAAILRRHRAWLVATQHAGLANGWCFPNDAGEPYTHEVLWRKWRGCLDAAGVEERVTLNALRRTFDDLARAAGSDAVVTAAITGHTEEMRHHYSTATLDEMRATLDGVIRLVVPREDE